jgi:hypothetical protein
MFNRKDSKKSNSQIAFPTSDVIFRKVDDDVTKHDAFKSVTLVVTNFGKKT